MTTKVHNCPLCLLFVKSDMFVILTRLGFGKPYTLGLAWFARPKTLACCLGLNPSARPKNYARPATTRNSLNTNNITDRIILFVIWGHNYWRNFFRPSFRRYILTDTFGRYLLTEWRTKDSELKKKAVRWRGGFCRWFYRRNHRGIQNGSSVRWRDRFTIWNADGITEGFKPKSLYSDVPCLPSE
jgi:hypothetical protein